MLQELPSDCSVAPRGAKIGEGGAVGIQSTEKAEQEPGLRGPEGRGEGSRAGGGGWCRASRRAAPATAYHQVQESRNSRGPG